MHLQSACYAGNKPKTTFVPARYKERFCDDCTIHLANGAVVNIAQAPSAAKLLGPGPDKQAGASGHASQHTSSSSGRGSRGGRKGSGTDSRAGSRSMNAQEQLLDRRSDPALTGTTVWDGAIVLAQVGLCMLNGLGQSLMVYPIQ